MTIMDCIAMKNREIPNDIKSEMNLKNNTPTSYENKNEILSNVNLQKEVGYVKMENGDYLVSMYCPMPNVTKEMVDWWFWWHPQADERYQAWFPGEHIKISFDKKQANYFNAKTTPDFMPNTHYPVERIGKLNLPLKIDFLFPTEFGFDQNELTNNGVATVVCGHVAAFYGAVSHTEMAHIFFQKEDGLFLVSRFWLGKRLKNPIIRHYVLTDETARGMAEHCCIEYRNFADRIPMLYKEYCK